MLAVLDVPAALTRRGGRAVRAPRDRPPATHADPRGAPPDGTSLHVTIPRQEPLPCKASGQARQSATPEAVVTARDLVRRYGEGDTAVDALRGVSVDIAAAA